MSENIPITVEIIDTYTGELRQFTDSLYRDDEYDGIYLWVAGNYECDCNRGNFFARAKNEPDRNELCNTGDNRYIVRISHAGEVLYSEFPERGGA